eukprot:760726-Hanusia_phi.AAC.3
MILACDSFRSWILSRYRSCPVTSSTTLPFAGNLDPQTDDKMLTNMQEWQNKNVRVPISASGYSYVQPLEEESEIEKTRTFPSSKEDLPLASSLKIPTTEDKFIPSYVTLDGKVLKFEAFLKDPIPDSPDYCIRKFSVWYYLVDNSMKINEIKQENSGLTQGVSCSWHANLARREAQELS